MTKTIILSIHKRLVPVPKKLHVPLMKKHFLQTAIIIIAIMFYTVACYQDSGINNIKRYMTLYNKLIT